MKTLLIAAALTVIATPSFAKSFTVKMISDASETAPYRFEPNTLTVQPGDTVKFLNMSEDPHDVMFEAVPRGVAGSGVLQCSFLGLPGKIGQDSPAA